MSIRKVAICLWDMHGILGGCGYLFFIFCWSVLLLVLGSSFLVYWSFWGIGHGFFSLFHSNGLIIHAFILLCQECPWFWGDFGVGVHDSAAGLAGIHSSDTVGVVTLAALWFSIRGGGITAFSARGTHLALMWPFGHTCSNVASPPRHSPAAPSHPTVWCPWFLQDWKCPVEPPFLIPTPAISVRIQLLRGWCPPSKHTVVVAMSQAASTIILDVCFPRYVARSTTISDVSSISLAFSAEQNQTLSVANLFPLVWNTRSCSNCLQTLLYCLFISCF